LFFYWKGSGDVEEFVQDLVSQLNVETVFTIFHFKIFESVVVTWIIMLIMVLIAAWLGHGLSVQHPSRRQAAAEVIVTKLDALTEGMLGAKGKQYSGYIATVLLFLGFANLIGIIGLKPPTKDINVTAGLAIMSIVLIEAAGVHARGVKGWLKSFAQPIAIVTPINILEVFIRPLSLCMRLFGNVLGAFVIMEMIKLVCPAIIPAIFSLYFDIFDGLIQAYVFVFLTSLYIADATE
jgi:F-type H+-transporting ATPase subunit a